MMRKDCFKRYYLVWYDAIFIWKAAWRLFQRGFPFFFSSFFLFSMCKMHFMDSRDSEIKRGETKVCWWTLYDMESPQILDQFVCRHSLCRPRLMPMFSFNIFLECNHVLHSGKDCESHFLWLLRDVAFEIVWTLSAIAHCSTIYECHFSWPRRLPGMHITKAKNSLVGLK